MFGIARAEKHPRVRSARPRLEVLEDRLAPAITVLEVAYEEDKLITVSGTVSEVEVVANRTISLGGVASGYATTNASGQFWISTDATDLGWIDVTDLDEANSTVYHQLTDVQPVITNFTAQETVEDLWLFSGDVTYPREHSGLKLTFSGPPYSFMMPVIQWTDNTGHFQFTRLLNGETTDNGYVFGRAESPWGTLSGYSSVNIQQDI